VDWSTTDLQAAIDSAAPGATLAVKGTCSGNFTIGKDLTLRGQGNAVLDGQHSGTTLTVASGAAVQLAGLTITGGNASGSGGGIYNSSGSSRSGSPLSAATAPASTAAASSTKARWRSRTAP
jgi:nitrous oxidase accessory protein NosD